MTRQYSNKDIAKMTNVSASTVSKVLGGYPGVARKTREKVMALVDLVGYVPNLSARALTGKQKKIIGLFLIHTDGEDFAYIPGLLALGVYNVASWSGYQVLSAIVNQDGSNLAEVLDIFRQERVDAGIFQAHTLVMPIIEKLIGEGYRIGLLDKTDLQGVVSAGLTHRECAQEAVDYLHGLGHRLFCIAPGSRAWKWDLESEKGFLLAIRRHGLSPVKWNAFEGGAKHFPTAVLCGSDGRAYKVIQTAKERGLRIPEDLSVVGMDDNPLGLFMSPPLTTFRFPVEEWITYLVQTLIALVENPQMPLPSHRDFTGVIMPRESCSFPCV